MTKNHCFNNIFILFPFIFLTKGIKMHIIFKIILKPLIFIDLKQHLEDIPYFSKE